MKGVSQTSTQNTKNNSENPKSSQIVIDNKYILQKKIGTPLISGIGSFGSVYSAYHQETNEQVAIKLEKMNNNDSKRFLLQEESQILQKLQASEFFPTQFSFGIQKNYYFIVMQRLGMNLEQKLKNKNYHFEIDYLNEVGLQMCQSLEYLHSIHYLHRDIKPENFMINENENKVYLIDFGLSKKYINENGKHIPRIQRSGLVGTARYASVNAHKGYEQSRRDDLISMVYLILYFFKGFLPWQNLQIQDKNEKFQKIQSIKETITPDELCKDCPEQLKVLYTYVMSLGYDEDPDYELMKELLGNFIYDKDIDEGEKQNVYQMTTFMMKKEMEEGQGIQKIYLNNPKPCISKF